MTNRFVQTIELSRPWPQSRQPAINHLMTKVMTLIILCGAYTRYRSHFCMTLPPIREALEGHYRAIVTMRPIGNSARICPFIPQCIQPHVNPICAFDTGNQFSIEPLNICLIDRHLLRDVTTHVAKLQNIILLPFNFRILTVIAKNIPSMN